MSLSLGARARDLGCVTSDTQTRPSLFLPAPALLLLQPYGGAGEPFTSKERKLADQEEEEQTSDLRRDLYKLLRDAFKKKM